MSKGLNLSDKGARFIQAHEGFVSKAYLCPAGVLTIGYGFTMGSKVFASYWRTKTGRDLRDFDTITKDEALKLLPLVVDEEYGKAVNSRVKPEVQHHYDAASSVAFNCGTGSLSWRWAIALAAKKVNEAASILRTTATTANGKQLPGLVSRRQAEARLLAGGNYGALNQSASTAPSVSRSVDEVKSYQQQLKALGYYTGAVDGKTGPLTKGAVENFQRANRLLVDGIVGPATRAALIRALEVKTTKEVSTIGAGGGGLVGGGSLPFDLPPGVSVAVAAAVVVLIIAVGSYMWRNRGKITGQRVST